MIHSDREVVVIGGGAAGIAAARRLSELRIRPVILEARSRLGGRAWTVNAANGPPLDLGCGWLHSADLNPWTTIARGAGFTIDESLPPWERPTSQIGMPAADRRAFGEALGHYRERIESIADEGPDLSAAHFLEPASEWNPLIDAISTYYSGSELQRVSTIDLKRYHDSGVNWRVVEGYGALVESWGRGVSVELDCEVVRIDHSGAKIRIQTNRGVVSTDKVIVTLPSAVIADRADLFAPRLPDKSEAASDLPLGLADKLFLGLSAAEAFEPESRAFGKNDRVETAGYHFRPFGRPIIEAYFGGNLASELEDSGVSAFFDFASTELKGLFGNDFGKRISAIAMHGWRNDPWARGSYSYARPGKAESRAVLAASIDDRLFFAGEACSRNDYSTAHGAYRTGILAAEQAVASMAN